ncbi:MAG TPA: aspartate-semialdehyde dehydrogenase [Candidatus Cloacimonas sp.]|jgi:aspartate-semialdehyde dehydrogenase|nr:aspartate-semialdehyde dehydrogenase [Candidatus Cloacimonas sp.]MDD2250245.1 aspartate-semialdehyde dehydrogenase [Candidatus Cloacimonadota bacterium]MDD3734055.1 aspartate-semialdehyde dehydrogenase [Candidatus Cloacimonadota bacterium]MDD4677067.1 aspartate-semialdehyde dehydrogenase [Candidatus Cloacimonadota bacterium]HNV93165.1 aspartate-semialdehyde dehydrogenase [Candidatus Cloacimonas sp.]
MKVAIVGATGEVGRMMITCLEESNLKVSELDLFASYRSAGTILYYTDQPLTVQELKEDSLLTHYDYVLFSAGAGVAKNYAPIAAQTSELVIDNSSGFRQESDIPLVVPQVNGELLIGYNGIVANPNCSTIQIILPLAVLDKLFNLNKLIVSTYQSVSGSGHQGIETLMKQRKGTTDKGIYPQIIDLNVIPQIGGFLDSGYCQEEEKMHFESRKILSKWDLAVCATTVRVPVVYGHSASVYAEFEDAVDIKAAETALQNAPGIVYYPNTYMTPLDLGSSNDSHTCRLRLGTDDKSLAFWNVGHNVRLGAAANAVEILKTHAKYSGKL